MQRTCASCCNQRRTTCMAQAPGLRHRCLLRTVIPCMPPVPRAPSRALQLRHCELPTSYDSLQQLSSALSTRRRISSHSDDSLLLLGIQHSDDSPSRAGGWGTGLGSHTSRRNGAPAARQLICAATPPTRRLQALLLTSRRRETRLNTRPGSALLPGESEVDLG